MKKKRNKTGPRLQSDKQTFCIFMYSSRRSDIKMECYLLFDGLLLCCLRDLCYTKHVL